MSGSKGLQRYVPRILQDSGMIASSEVAHYTHLKLVQYVKADDIDAALRRAKAEAAREAIKVCRDRMLLWQSHGGAKLASPYSHLTIEGEYQVIIDEIDARAAQIENEATK